MSNQFTYQRYLFFKGYMICKHSKHNIYYVFDLDGFSLSLREAKALINKRGVI